MKVGRKKAEKAVGNYEKEIGEGTGDLTLAYIGATGFIAGIKFAESDLERKLMKFIDSKYWNEYSFSGNLHDLITLIKESK